jgi:predicted unusual protein kinase regulating ubiquinone biosynthesis (AarF/ABC1/UbiB family)
VAALDERKDEAIHISPMTTKQRRNDQAIGNFPDKLFAWIKSSSIKRIAMFVILTALATKAFTTGTPFRLLPTILYQHYKMWKRPLFALFVIWQYVAHRQVKQRQAQDATSEWGRYARNPGARGRALLTLVLVVTLGGYLPSRGWQWIGAHNRAETLLQKSGQRLTTGLLQLGPLYIKLGQIISCRSELLPAPWIKAMERLQDQVPAQSGEKAWALVQAAWPSEANSTGFFFEKTFSNFNDMPIAAASLGQVHTATLRETGDIVAIKLQRPYLREMYDQDFALLTKLAGIMDRFSGRSMGDVGGIKQNWTEIFIDAEEILYREIDYRDEAENAMRFCSDFGLTLGGNSVQSRSLSKDGKELPSAATWLRTPYVYSNLSSEKILVNEYVPSIKITKNDKLEAAGVNDEDKMYLADCLGRAYLRQLCCHNFFSTDPHPGNLGVELLNMNATKPEDRVRLVFYDFGQAATLTAEQGDGILDIIDAIVDSDVDRSMTSFQKMGVLQPDADMEKVRAKIADNYRTGKIKANRKRLKERGYQFRETVKQNITSNATSTDAEIMKYFKLPAEYAFVARALSQMDGVGKSLDPDFDFVSAAAPWIYEIKGAGKYIKEEAKKRIDAVKEQINKLFSLEEPCARIRKMLDEWFSQNLKKAE